MLTSIQTLKEYCNSLFCRPTIREFIADDMVEAQKEVMQYKNHIQTYLFLQHMAEYKIAAMIQWEQICKEKRNAELNNVRNSQ